MRWNIVGSKLFTESFLYLEWDIFFFGIYAVLSMWICCCTFLFPSFFFTSIFFCCFYRAALLLPLLFFSSHESFVYSILCVYMWIWMYAFGLGGEWVRKQIMYRRMGNMIKQCVQHIATILFYCFYCCLFCIFVFVSFTAFFCYMK